jgi:hypothetical protein
MVCIFHPNNAIAGRGGGLRCGPDAALENYWRSADAGRLPSVRGRSCACSRDVIGMLVFRFGCCQPEAAPSLNNATPQMTDKVAEQLYTANSQLPEP